MNDADKIELLKRKLRNSEKGGTEYMKALIELRNIPGSGYEMPSGTEDQPMDNDPSEVDEKSGTALKAGGMARGRGGKMYKHNYATGGQVVDHLSKVTGPPMGGQPQSVQAATATVETPAQRSKRLRMGG